MAINPLTYRGENAAIQIGGKAAGRKHNVIVLSDFSLTLDPEIVYFNVAFTTSDKRKAPVRQRSRSGQRRGGWS